MQHTLWKVSNGWLLVPEGTGSALTPGEASEALIFKSLREFSDWKPKRQRRKRTKATQPQQPTTE